jgi:hypothetical protein
VNAEPDTLTTMLDVDESTPFDRIRKSADPKLPGWRLRVSAECTKEIEIIEETVHPEQVDNPEARHTTRRERILVVREEAMWLRDALNEWLTGGVQ